MKKSQEILVSFLDGALPQAQALQVEAALEKNAALRAELEELMAGDNLAKAEFDAMLNEPVPIALAAALRNGASTQVPVAKPARAKSTPLWMAMAACVALLVGSLAGYAFGTRQVIEVAQTQSWLADIADYHRVYSAQDRHLVEVAADEADHIQTWLSGTVGAPVRIPDLSQYGLAFRGGRLLVAAGKPVAQLMFTDANGQVVALCVIANSSPQDGFAAREQGGFAMVTWGGEGANFVVVGEQERTDLNAIARTAARSI